MCPGYLLSPGDKVMSMLRGTTFIAGLVIAFVLGWWMAGRNVQGGDDKIVEGNGIKGWTKGKGWGPWGKDDEIGSLNAMSSASIKSALGLIKQGKVYDL